MRFRCLRISYRAVARPCLTPRAGLPMNGTKSGFDTGRFAELLRLISLNDHMLMRGLGALLRADVAWQRAELQEAGPIMLYVALEASFQLVLRTFRGKASLTLPR